MSRVLMIDDDARLAAMVREYLAGAAIDVTVAGDGRLGLAALDAGLSATGEPPFDLLILDLMLPDTDGLELCRLIRVRADPVAQMPILMLTAKGDPVDRVLGLELGADDYLPKPFEPRELLARIRAVLRRRPAGSSRPAGASRVLRFGRLAIDAAARSVQLDDAARSLTAHQFDLLLALAERAGRVLSREQLLDLAPGQGGGGAEVAFDRSIDVHIARIRAAIEDDVRHPKRIITVRGAGYVFARAQD